MFCHIRDIQPKHAVMNPTLYTGEYVMFSTAPNGRDISGVPRIKAVNITGVNGGTLLCDHGQINYSSYSRVQFNNSRSAGAAAATAEEEDTVADELTNI